MRIFTSLFCFLFLLPALRAQSIPGYLGKRFVVSYEAALMAAYNSPNTAEIDYNGQSGGSWFFGSSILDMSNQKISLNYKHRLQVEFALTKKSSLLATGGFFQSYYGSNLIINSNSSSFVFSGDPEPILQEHGTITNYDLFLGYRIYSKHFAPLGSYFDFKLGYQTVQYGALSFDVPATEDEPAKNRLVPGGSTGTFALMVGWGVNRVIADRVMINYGMEVGFNVQGFSASQWQLTRWVLDESDFPNIDPRFDTDAQAQDAMAEAALGRVFDQSIFNFKLGIGILP